jgi:CHASE2 domain-containing sensor protein
MQPESHHAFPWEHFLTGFAVVIVAALLTVRLHETSFLHWADLANLDAWILIHKPEPSREIVVVDITDNDYRELFDSQSPLAPARLRTLIWAIAASYPKAIGVDLDTSEWKPSQRQWLPDKIKIDQTGVPGSVPVVWALGGSPVEGRGDGEMRVTFDSVNGGLGSYCWAVPGVLPDEDGIVRSYMQSVADSKGHRMFGFAAALSAVSAKGMAGCLQTPPALPAGEPYPRIAFSGGRDAFEHFTASLVLGAAFSDAWKITNPLRGKIVLLGGSYRAARDKYVTPVAYLDGVDILAHSLQSISSPNQVREVGKELFLWIDLALGAVLVTLTYWKKLWAEILAFLLVPVISLLGSLLIYNSLGYFASVMPVVLGVAVHAVIEHIVEHHKLNRELTRLRRELHEIKAK